MTDDTPDAAERNAHAMSSSQREQATAPIFPVLVSLGLLGVVHQFVDTQFAARLGGPAINMVLTDLLPVLIAASVVITSACPVGCYATRIFHD